jgi:hypothetical protein
MLLFSIKEIPKKSDKKKKNYRKIPFPYNSQTGKKLYGNLFL